MRQKECARCIAMVGCYAVTLYYVISRGRLSGRRAKIRQKRHIRTMNDDKVCTIFTILVPVKIKG